MFAIVEGDLRLDETINSISELKPDIIIHLVSLDHFDSEKEPKFVNDVNVLPTWRLLNNCNKMNLKKFIYFSTIHVYGKLGNDIINESHKIHTNNIYGLTHLLSENICNHYRGKTATDIITVRLSNSYGSPIFHDNNCWWLVINELCKEAFINKKILLKSDGSPQRDFIHGDDVCRAIVQILENRSKKYSNSIFHISSGETLTILEIAKKIKEVYCIRYSKDLQIITPNGIVSENEETLEADKYEISNRKIRQIGFSTSVSIQDGINDLFDYLEKNHDKL
jgi:UDP-glucose 4-epimerase